MNNFFHDGNAVSSFFFDGTGGTFLLSRRDLAVRTKFDPCTGGRNEDCTALGTKAAVLLVQLEVSRGTYHIIRYHESRK